MKNFIKHVLIKQFYKIIHKKYFCDNLDWKILWQLITQKYHNSFVTCYLTRRKISKIISFVLGKKFEWSFFIESWFLYILVLSRFLQTWHQKIAIFIRMQFLNDIIKSRSGFKTTQDFHKFLIKTKFMKFLSCFKIMSWFNDVI